MKSFDTLDNWHDEFLRQVNQFSSLSFQAVCDIVVTVELAYHYSITPDLLQLAEEELLVHVA